MIDAGIFPGIEIEEAGNVVTGGDDLPEVRCSVSNCGYWTEGNRCQADVIMVEIDKHAEANFNEEFAGESFDSDHRDRARNTSDTCCHTFEPRKVLQET